MIHASTDQTPMRQARISGILYLVIILFAGFTEGYIRSSLIVPGDAAATAANIMASESLFRVGFALDLIAFICDAAVAVLFYLLLKPVSKSLAMVAAALRLLAHPAIGSLNLLNHLGVLFFLGGGDHLASFNPEQLQALAMVLLEAHRYGYLIGGAFFGFHCLLLGYLLFRSDWFPKTLGVLMVVASFGYLIESFGNFVAPAHAEVYSWLVVGPAVVAELSLCLWLLIRGVRTAAVDHSAADHPPTS